MRAPLRLTRQRTVQVTAALQPESRTSRFLNTLTSLLTQKTDNLPFKFLSLLLGFYMGTGLRPIALGGQPYAPAVACSLGILLFTEVVSYFAYSPGVAWARKYPRMVELLNIFKAGWIFGLFTDAFKVGS